MAKVHELNFELLPHPPYSPYPLISLPETTGCSQTKKMLAGKKFRSYEEAIAETQTYFEAKDKSFYKSGIEMLGRRWNNNNINK